MHGIPPFRERTQVASLAAAVSRSEALNKSLQERLADVAGRAGGGVCKELPAGWYRGKLPGLGSCGGRGGNLRKIWDVWGGVGPEVALGAAGATAGLNLRSHGDVTLKQQEAWCSTSSYSRYAQTGRYMDANVASIKVNARRGCDNGLSSSRAYPSDGETPPSPRPSPGGPS